MADSAIPGVLFIAGAGRSGTTLLDRLIGGSPGAWSLGEVNDIWADGFRDNGFCGCGERFLACPFWSEVSVRAFGPSGPDTARALRLKARLRRLRDAPGLRFGRLRPDEQGRTLAAYGELLRPLYAAARAVSGAALLVDSSKYAFHGAVLAAIGGLDVRTVHLVRDSRAVAFSWSRVRANPAPGAARRAMPRRGPAGSARLWAANTLAAELLAPRPKLTLRYEDLAHDAQKVLARVRVFAGLPAASGDELIRPNHIVSGNPMRFAHGPVTVRLDDEWRDAMPRGARTVVTAMTWPWLLRYGYLRERRDSPSPAQSGRGPGGGGAPAA